ncbi:AAA domain-containing protein, putative AbiEii toxin, Type IV TA system [Desulfosporosinus hippei DSM 8344]|uniref:AAA domain-containing protein, putative AbiEii toxin, Type IV TA system n=1 Tax=Desulfosporosinus hippei DSM 8344 TaxID=1121419 RepID=A0A1G8CDJ6_9FIRM|nr:AAA family ATPase [Desulfosporosinus hippei]SDH42930.1 AAA domain-containing protein, putative AbiEii toxin, Type IV TA system [Desulfosporosinus hippei DSM 8344]
MELLYIWVKKYGCFDNAGFNFNPKHRFVFKNETLILKYYQNKNTTDDFFSNEENKNTRKGKILNINAIVGGNGSGKTTLLEIIFSNLVYGEGGIKTESIFVFNNNNRMKVYYYKLANERPQKIYLESDGDYLELFDLYSSNEIRNELSEQDVNRFIKELEDTCFIYLSNTFDNRYYDYVKMGNISDLSTIGLLKSNSNFNMEMGINESRYDINKAYFYAEFNKQINFITKYKDQYYQYIPFELPRRVIVYFKSLDILQNEILKRIDNTKINEKLESLFNKFNNLSHKDNFKYNIARRLLTMLLNDFLNEPNGYRKTNILDIEVESALKYTNFKKDIWEFTGELFKRIQKNLVKNNFVDRYLEFMVWIDKHIDEIGDFKNIYEGNYFEIPTFVEDSKDSIGIQEFFSHYQKTAGIIDYLNFSWGLSTGENTLLSLFSRLFSITQRLPQGGNYLIGNGNTQFQNKFYKKAIILIDEADLTLHPEWQQKYIKSFVDFIEDIYQECETQIIITTHSPIILSDIPKNNVIFLKAKNKQVNEEDDDNIRHSETFGSNVTTLFYDSFFMKKGSIGQFAKEKINYVIKRINNIDTDIELEDSEFVFLSNVTELRELRKIIQNIGDDVLKNKLNQILNYKLELLEEKLDDLKDIKTRINDIDEQIKRLEERKKLLNGENL